MKKLGGYKLIDFGGVDISTSKTISGIYNEIEKTDKRIVGCNLKLGTTTFKELTLDVKKDGTNLVLSNSIIKVTITNANAVVGEEQSSGSETKYYATVNDLEKDIKDGYGFMINTLLVVEVSGPLSYVSQSREEEGDLILMDGAGQPLEITTLISLSYNATLRVINIIYSDN